eukprot:gb/GECG01007817.1/.p1 GENE.gb/GECG01007817.1/~~gb/GECG01007817.1/.p1  ORF type:complete len:137 (+),score=16.30 gb/GECG01007817.1/:1-411(+)
MINFEGKISEEGTSVALFYGDPMQDLTCPCIIKETEATENGAIKSKAECSLMTISAKMEYWMILNPHTRAAALGMFSVEFLAPTIEKVQSDGTELHTGGKNLLTLFGTNFGVLGDEAVVTYGEITGKPLEVSIFLA